MHIKSQAARNMAQCDCREHTSLLYQDDDQTGEDFKNFCHHHGWCGVEMISRQRPHVTDAEDERCILDHQNRQTDVLQLLIDCKRHDLLVKTSFFTDSVKLE